ncbi:MAG: GH39 family glycosyl hydrolase [Planctomycetota bacterium]
MRWRFVCMSVAVAALVYCAEGNCQPPGRFGPPPKSTPYGQGTKELSVVAAKSVGVIPSLLGTNRGPLSFARRPGEESMSHVESFRRMGIDCIRTHDFYGPTDWYVIFPDWTADPLDPASYDFAASDERIKAIVENGFDCFYRLGTSWRGRSLRPINDPPGTIRDRSGRVTHVANRDDFRKWAAICVQTVRHYTEGWKDGFHYPITYWEIWNEPDLAEQFWTGTTDQYYMMYEEAARALKELNPKLKVGGPASTGRLRREYVEDFIGYCRERNAPLDFFSWHSYGGRGGFNPHQNYQEAMRIRGALDNNGYPAAELILSEWNAGIQKVLFSDTPAGAAYYASTLACLADAGVSRAFQYCGDRHPGLGLHDLRTGELKLCAYSFMAWKRLLETPQRLAASGSDERGYNLIAGQDEAKRRMNVLISDFQSGHDTFRLTVKNLPWGDDGRFTVRRWLLDGEQRMELVETQAGSGSEFVLERPFRAGSVCLVEIERGKAEDSPTPTGP